MVKKRNSLGRGLSALLDEPLDNTPLTNEEGEFTVVNAMAEIPLDQIVTNPYQPRTHFDRESLEELAESIRVQGIIQPITVRQLSSNEYQLISGERRFQASKMIGLTGIPAYVRIANDQQMLEMALIENIQRENLNAMEIALSYQRLISECNLKHEELGDRVGKKRSTVNNYLRLLKLPPDIQASIRDAALSMGHARAIINVDDVDKQLHIFNRILRDDLSVRQVEELVRDLVTSKDEDAQRKQRQTTLQKLNPDLAKLQTKLSSHLGAKVLFKMNGEEKGEIKIPFASDEDLNRILELIHII